MQLKTIATFFIAASLGAQQLPLTDKAWNLYYAYQSIGGNGIPLATPKSGGIQYAMPLYGSAQNPSSPYLTGAWAGYLIYNPSGRKEIVLNGNINISGSIVTSSPSVVFRYDSESFNTCISPATLRPWFQGRLPSGGDNRWWNVAAILLAPGPFSLSISMDPSQWSNSTGQFANQDATTLANFNAARVTVTDIGATHGGGCFAGHGVAVDGGTATVTITSYAVNQ